MTMLQAVGETVVSLLPSGERTGREQVQGGGFVSLLREITERFGGHGGSGDDLYAGAPAPVRNAAGEAVPRRAAASTDAGEDAGEADRGAPGEEAGEAQAPAGEEERRPRDTTVADADGRPDKEGEQAPDGRAAAAAADEAAAAAARQADGNRRPGEGASSGTSRSPGETDAKAARKAPVRNAAEAALGSRFKAEGRENPAREARDPGNEGGARNAAAFRSGGDASKEGAAARSRAAALQRTASDAAAGAGPVHEGGDPAGRNAGGKHAVDGEEAGEAARRALQQGRSAVRKAAGRGEAGTARTAGEGPDEGGGRIDGTTRLKVELRREQDFQAPGRGAGEGGLSPGTRKDFFALVREQGVQQAGLRQTQNPRTDDGAFDQMVRQFNLVLRRGGGEARMQLHPENLGSMKLSVRLQRNELSTSIVVENQAVKELIMSRLPGLQESLAQQGFQIGSFQVEVQDRGSTREEGERAPQQVRAALKEAIALAEDTMMAEAGVPWMSAHINVTV